MVYFGVDAHITNAANTTNATSWNVTETPTSDIDLPAIFGKKHLISEEVGLYTKLMAVTAVLTIIDMHLENVFVNLGYVKSAMLNSLISGLGLNVACTYTFIFHLQWGMFGAALVQITVRTFRCLCWCFYACIYRKCGLFCNCRCRSDDSQAESVLSMREFRVFVQLSVPAIISYFGGWFIFELQILALSYIRNIGQAALAAGAIWVQSESLVASMQTGWITVVKMRVMNLMGAKEKGAGRAFAILCLLSAGMVLASNIPLVAASYWIARIVSNDSAVQQWFAKLVWLLALHAQTRVTSINMSNLFVAFDKPILANVMIYGCYYGLSVPLTVIISLTDYVTEDVHVKLTMCLGTAALAQGLVIIVAAISMCRFDWTEIAGRIAARANTDMTQIDDDSGIPSADEIKAYVHSYDDTGFA